MKPHRILKSFTGNQDGQHHCQEFIAGTIRDLSAGLATIVVKENWATPVLPQEILLGQSEPVAQVFLHDTPIPALARQTKIVGPEEAKEGANPGEPPATKPLEAMDFKELQALAKTRGAKTFGMSQEKLLAALKAE